MPEMIHVFLSMVCGPPAGLIFKKYYDKRGKNEIGTFLLYLSIMSFFIIAWTVIITGSLLT